MSAKKPLTKKQPTRSKSTVQRSYNDRKVTGVLRKLPFGVLFAITVAFAGLLGYAYIKDIGSSSAAGGAPLSYLDDGKYALLGGVKSALVVDINGNGTISLVNGGVNYTSNPVSVRSEHRIGAHNKPLWTNDSSGWFAFDFTLHDTDSSWRVIEQEHEGNSSPSRALEAGGSTVKLVSRFGAPHSRGPDKSWNISPVKPGQRIQVVGYEKFGQGNAVMQAWWRPYGQTTWTQFANSSNFSMGYNSGYPGRYHKRGTYHGNENEKSSVTWYGTALMFDSRSSAEAAAGITGGTAPTPTPTPGFTGVLAPNNWSAWVPGAGTYTTQPVTRSQNGNLLIQFDANKQGYKTNQWANYCLSIPASLTVPKSVTFTATYNPYNYNRLYAYVGVASNKLWTADNTLGVATTKTITLPLSGQRKVCFGNEAKDNFVAPTLVFSQSRYLKINSYNFNR